MGLVGARNRGDGGPDAGEEGPEEGGEECHIS